MHRRQFVTAVGAALAALGFRSATAASGTCLAPLAQGMFRSGFEPGESSATPPPYYLPERLLFIHWDAPRIAHVGVDIDYPLSGYDWFNRGLSWRLLDGPADMSIDSAGRLHWVPTQQGTVCVRVELRAGADSVQSAFTVSVDNARCVFVDGRAHASGDGSRGAPFQTLFEALATVQSGLGRVVYLRAGMDYRIEGVSWYAQPPGNPYRVVAQGSWTEADPLLIRAYPGERVRYSFAHGSGFVLGERAVLIGLELAGGDAGEMAALVMNAGAVAKHVQARDYSCSGQNNCAGVKLTGGCLLDRVEAFDNFDRSNLDFHNSSNFLFYGTGGLPERADAFLLDCISSGFSVQGFKIKHAGAAGRLHLHRCVGYGTRNAFAGASNRSSVRHSLLQADLGESSNGGYVLGLGVTDPSTGGQVNLDGGMLVEHNLVIGSHPESQGLAQADYAFASGSPLSARYAHNDVIVSRNAGAGCGYTTHRYASLPAAWTAGFDDNRFVTQNAHNCVRLGSQFTAGVEHLNAEYGQDNAHVISAAPLQRDLAGHRWRYDPAEDRLRRDGVAVSQGHVVVRGSGFGSKPTQATALWETFQGEAGQLLRDFDPSWVAYAGPGALITDLNPRFPGHRSAYSDFGRGQFWTNYRRYTPSRSVFLSMWVRAHNFRPGLDGGVAKLQRVASSTAAGGGGDYNGEGVHTLGGTSPPAWYASWSGSENLLNNLGYLDGSWYPTDAWRRIEYEIRLNDVDVDNGFYNVHLDRLGSKRSGPIMQRRRGFPRSDFLLDSTLLGLMIANPHLWYRPVQLTPNTDYRVNVSGATYLYRSGAGVPTAQDVVEGLSAQLSAASIVHRTQAGQIQIDWARTSVYDSSFEQLPPWGLQVAELYLDTDFKRFYCGDADTWTACAETNVMPYSAWSDNLVLLRDVRGAIEGRRWLYFQALPDTEPQPLGEIVDGAVV